MSFIQLLRWHVLTHICDSGMTPGCRGFVLVVSILCPEIIHVHVCQCCLYKCRCVKHIQCLIFMCMCMYTAIPELYLYTCTSHTCTCIHVYNTYLRVLSAAVLMVAIQLVIFTKGVDEICCEDD